MLLSERELNQFSTESADPKDTFREFARRSTPAEAIAMGFHILGVTVLQSSPVMPGDTLSPLIDLYVNNNLRQAQLFSSLTLPGYANAMKESDFPLLFFQFPILDYLP